MTDIPEPIRRAMEAQARRTGKIDVAAVEAALAAGNPIPPDEVEVAEQAGDWLAMVPDEPDLSEAERAMIDQGEQLPLVPDDVKPYRANDDVPAAHAAAQATVEREGKKRMVTPGSHRHTMLRCFHDRPMVTLIDAGQYAYEHLGVGRGTMVRWDEGRRRASELAEFGLLDRTVGSGGEAFYSVNEHGVRALRVLDAGYRWDADEHDWSGEPT